MSDDWRVRVDLRADGAGQDLRERLEAAELEHDLKSSFNDRAAVSGDDNEVFIYAGTREQAESAAQVVRSLAAEHGWHVEIELRRWHPVAEEWEDPDKPLPATGTEEAVEHAVMIERERQESEAMGHPEFEVRVECRSRGDAIALAAKLRGEGVPNVRRWNYLVVGAADEDSAKAMAERLQTEVPDGATVIAEGTPQAVRAAQPGNPFAIFGGLGG